MTGTINFTGVSAGAGIPLLQMRGAQTSPGVNAGTASLDALRCDPLNNLFNTFSVSLNGNTNTTNLNLYNRILQRYQRTYEDIQDLSYAPTYPDFSTDYEDLFEQYLDPLGVFGNNQVDQRGAFAGTLLTSNTSTGVADTATVQFNITAPFELSPFCEMRGKGEPVSLKGITNFVVNMTLGGRGSSPIGGAFGSMWSHNNLNALSGTITAGTVSFSSATILMHFMSPPLGQPLPDLVRYSWTLPTLYQQTTPGVVSGATTTQNSQTLQLTTIPPRIYVWMDKADYLMDATQTDTTPFTITRVAVRWDTQSNLLADMTAQDLWAMSRANGCNITWNQWVGTKSAQTGNITGCGSILCIMPGIDFSLPNASCPGQEGKHTMQITVTATNFSSNNVVQATVNVLVCDEGCLTIQDRLVQYSTAMVTDADVASTQNMAPITHMPSKTVLGGSFWSDIKNFLGKVARPVFDATRSYLPAPVAQVGNAVLEAYGRGMPGRTRGGAILSPNQLQMLS